MKTEKLVIFTGPSGAGKSTVEKLFLSDHKLNLHFSVSATTRPKRVNEVDGVNYWFLTKDEFVQKISNNEFIEWAKYAGNYYGTLKSEVDDNLKAGKIIFLEIEVIGAKNIMKLYEGATTIFLMPPTYFDLEKRLLNRKTDSLDVIKKRLEIAKKELDESKYFKHIIINDDSNRAANEIRDILKKI